MTTSKIKPHHLNVNKHLPVAVVICFANVADVVHLLGAAMVHRLALGSPVELAVLVLLLISSNKQSVSHTSMKHHQFVGVPEKKTN